MRGVLTGECLNSLHVSCAVSELSVLGMRRTSGVEMGMLGFEAG